MNASPGGAPAGAGPTQTVIQMLDENMRKLEEMQEEKIRMRQQHEEEKERLEEKMEELIDAWMEQKAQIEQELQEEKEKKQREIEELQAERQRLEAEKVEMQKQFREDRARALQEAQEETRRVLQQARKDMEEELQKEREENERTLQEARRNTEEQLQKERAVTGSIMAVLKELPPLQAAMELGDLRLLDTELHKWRGQDLSHFGECRGVVEAVVKLAHERMIIWRGVEHTWTDVLREVERMPSSLPVLSKNSQRIFRTLKEAQLTKMDIRKSDPQAMDKVYNVIMAWQSKAMSYSNEVQKLMVRKALYELLGDAASPTSVRASVVDWPKLGAFDFADLEICLRLVDRSEEADAIFLSRARSIVEEPNTQPKDMRSLLSHVETMLFFLKYVASEDLQLTHLEFQKQSRQLDALVAGYLAQAARDYPPGKELVRLSGRALMDSSDVKVILQELRTPPTSMMSMFGGGDSLGWFREIFYQWAVAMHTRFDLLVLPHHTQVVTLLAFRQFLEGQQSPQATKALIAQVGTGEGKSMLVAALAIYAVVAKGKSAHVVVDDETLLERDFSTFKRLFDSFEVPTQGGKPKRKLRSVLCVSEDKAQASGDDASLVVRVDPEADICYCEAKHVQSFYASIARGSDVDFTTYDNRILILDEVDALVIDEEPNEAFVYPNEELSEMATSMAAALMRNDMQAVRAHAESHPAGTRVVNEMMSEWKRGGDMVAQEDFVFVKELGKYCALHSGRANTAAWSLALECRNFRDGLSTRIFFQERLFVMSRPRVFRKYSRMLGLSGSIGSQPERNFLRDTYKALFFEVPPFLKTCRGSPFHEAASVRTGSQSKAVYVEADQEAQLARISELALDARERVPVLVIAKDRSFADLIVERLRQGARSRGLGATSEDIVRLLSRTLYESDPEQWKENLNRSTLSVGDAGAGTKAWRITVTDPRGGRGTDYRVDDSEVDARGGLLLVPTTVPTSRRDWTQFIGRTARQDRKGQYCCVLNAGDYAALSQKYSTSLPTDGSLAAVDMVLTWGDQEAAERVRASASLYNTGVRVNELCEEVLAKRPEIIKNPATRETVVDICQRHRWMSVSEVTEAFGRLLDAAAVPTEAKDMGRPQEPPVRRVVAAPGQGGPPAPKAVVFCLDWSASMMSRDTRTPHSRFELCQASIQKILQEQVHDADLVSVVGFGPNVQIVCPPTSKKTGSQNLTAQIASLKPQSAGGTCFYDAVTTSLKILGQPALVPLGGMRWVICLTDGDDLGSQRGNQSGELVTQMLHSSALANLNMVMITVGPMKQQNLQIMDSWVNHVTGAGGQGMRISETDAVNITKAFEVVAEYLAADVGGAVEC